MTIFRVMKRCALIVLFISTFSYAGHQWLLDQSTVFTDDALEVNIGFGDANNDGSIDMLIGKHKDYGTGRTAAFQQTESGWDAGTVIYSGGNGNMHPIVGEINGSNWLVFNKHDQYSWNGNLQFHKYDADFNLINNYTLSSLNETYFSDQVFIGETVYFNNRYRLGKAEWSDLNLIFTSTELADNGEGHPHASIAANDLTGDGVQEIIYWTYDGSNRGLSVLVNETPFEIQYGYTTPFTIGQFDPASPVSELFYANNSLDEFVLVRYNTEVQTFVSQIVLNGQQENAFTLAPFDMNGDGTDEILFATTTGEIFKYDLVSGQLETIIVSDVFWYDSVVADWGDGSRAVFVGSQNGDVSVVAFGQDIAVIDNIAGNAYLQGKAIDVQWTYNGTPTTVDVQVRDITGETWTTMATVSSQAGASQLIGLSEGEYDLRLADAADNHSVYGQIGTFYVYACTQALAGDFDGNCYVDLFDFAVLASGNSQLSDLAQLAADWLRCGNPYDEYCNDPF